MKWAKTKAELEKIRNKLKERGFTNFENEINANYQELTAEPTLCGLHEKNFSEWLVIKKLPKGYENARARYEAFVGGYLYFFEKHVSKIRKDNRLLYFDWGKINKEAELTIFLNPLYNKFVIADKSGSDSESGNGKYSPNQNSGELQKAIVAPSPSESTDPPPPPPPPPPARE
jgi:hypothetical protein